jgi:hypothetical protein
MIHWSLSNMFYCFQLFSCFLLLFLLLISSFSALWSQIECMKLFLFSYICWGLLCALKYDQFWKRFHELLRRMYIVQKLGEIFCRFELGPFGLWCDLILGFFYWFFCLDDLSIGDRGVLRTHTITVLQFIYVFRSFRVCLMKLDVLTLGAYRLMIISFWCISPFINIECPSLSHLINVSLKSTLSNISIASPACLWGQLSW